MAYWNILDTGHHFRLNKHISRTMSVSVFSWKKERKNVSNQVDWFCLLGPSPSVFPLPFPPGNTDSFTFRFFSVRWWMKYHLCLKYCSSSSLSAWMIPGHCFQSHVFTWVSFHTDRGVNHMTCTSLWKSAQEKCCDVSPCVIMYGL